MAPVSRPWRWKAKTSCAVPPPRLAKLLKEIASVAHVDRGIAAAKTVGEQGGDVGDHRRGRCQYVDCAAVGWSRFHVQRGQASGRVGVIDADAVHPVNPIDRGGGLVGEVDGGE